LCPPKTDPIKPAQNRLAQRLPKINRSPFACMSDDLRKPGPLHDLPSRSTRALPSLPTLVRQQHLIQLL
jgi:hypothetical protein